MRKIFAVSLCVLALFVFAGCASAIYAAWAGRGEEPAPVVEALPPIDLVELSFTPGTFYGVAWGYVGNIHVAVTVSDTEILDIEVTEHVEDLPWADPAFNFMIPEMLRLQTPHVDIWTGSTVSSEALIRAVDAAIRQAASE